MRYTFLYLFLLVGASLAAQKGSQLVGGNFDISSFKEAEGDAFSIKLQGGYGYFVSNRIVLGSSVHLNIQKYFRTKAGLGPFMRFYFYKLYKSSKVNLFAQYQFLASINKPRGYDAQYTINNELSLGHTLFISDKVALEGLLYYGRQKILSTQYNQGYWGFKVGFQYFLIKN